MYILISIFYISILGMAAMILLKRREVVTGRQSVVSRVGAGSDHIFQAVFSGARKALSYCNRRTFTALAHWVAYHVLFYVRKIYVEIKDQFIATPHGKKLIDAVRGRGEIKDHGASFFLRRISADHPVK